MGVNGIYGLSGSGIDVESMVKVGMMSRQNEYDKMAQKFTKNEWIKADYLELNNKITTFNASTLSQYKMSTTMNARTAESSSAAVKVTANSTAGLMNHKVAVSELSSNAYLISSKDAIKRINTGSDTYSSDSIYLKDILFSNLTLSSDGTKVSATTLRNGVAAYDNNNVWQDDGKNYVTGDVALTNNAIAFKISDGVTMEKDADGNVKKDASGNEILKKAEITFTYKEIMDGVTLNDLASRINAAGLNIRASYDSVQDQFTLYNKQGGADNNIRIETYDNNGTNLYAGSVAMGFFNELNLKQSISGEIDESKTFKLLTGQGSAGGTNTDGSEKWSFTAAGKSGTINVDGIDYTTTDNRVTVGGVTYTALNQTATKDSDGNITLNAATVSVTQDTDSIMDKVKSFVTDYNKLLADLYAKYDEKPNSDYKPLTQSQKDQMKDDQIEKWEEKAKAGLLYHDSTLGKVIQSMRSAVSETVDGIEGKYNSIYSLGISTTGIKGQLVLDEDKLKTALANDPDAVYNVFAKLESTTTNSASAVYQTETDASGRVTVTNKSNGNGIAQRLGDIFVEANKLIKDRAGSSADITEDSDLNTLLRNLQTKMSNFKRAMNTFEDALYKKYDNMESTLAKLGMQLNYVMGSSGQ